MEAGCESQPWAGVGMVPAPETRQAQHSMRELGTAGTEESAMLDLAQARLRRAAGNSNTASSCGKQQQSHKARHQETAFTVGCCSQGG